MPKGLRLEQVTPENVRAACQLLIYNGDELVGFIMAAFDPGNADDLYHSYLWRLNIGADHQGEGYGRFAVECLCQEVLRRGQYRLTVSYHLDQHGPEGFYLNLGFRRTGKENQGEIIAERILVTNTKPGVP